MRGGEVLVCEFVIHLLFLVIHALASIAENDEARMTNDESMTKLESSPAKAPHVSSFGFRHSFVIRASSLPPFVLRYFHSFVIVACPVKSFRFRDENGNATDLVWAVRI